MSPRRLLIEHFFAGMFRSEMLSEAGIENYRTWLISAAAALFAFHTQFARLRARNFGQPSDELFVTAASFVTVLLLVSFEWQSLFPGARDWQVLSPLPVRKSDIFVARLTALGMFLGIAMIAANLVPSGLYLSWRHWVAAIGAGLHAVLLAMALQGPCLLVLPRVFGFVVQALLLAVSIVSLPLLLHVPGLRALDRLEWLPPMWWVGVCDARYARLADRAWIGLGICFVVAMVSCAVLYRRFGEFASPPLALSAWRSPLTALNRLSDRGVLAFVALTLARAPQHRLLLIGIALFGAAFTFEGFVVALLKSGRNLSAIARAFPLLLGMSLTAALTMCFRLPAEWRAHWVFRVTEDPLERPGQLSATVAALYFFGAMPALVIALPFQVAASGPLTAAAGLPITFGFLACLIELRVQRWYRIPFTSTYAPSQMPAAIALVMFLASFLAFGSFGGMLVGVAASSVQGFAIVGGITAVTWVLLRRKRLAHWGDEPLEFTDDAGEVLVTRFAPE